MWRARQSRLVVPPTLLSCQSDPFQRVHRIGQTRPVTGAIRSPPLQTSQVLITAVKTLAIRGTAEEMMLQQRAVLKGTVPTAANWTEQKELRRFVEVCLTFRASGRWLTRAAVPTIPRGDARRGLRAAALSTDRRH
jgi:hypothetical protein